MGLLGIYNVPNVSTALYYGIHNLHHRGQEGAGMATFDENGKCLRHRGLGLVDSIFDAKSISELKGSIGMATVRYANIANSGLDTVQPLFFRHSTGDFVVAGDGCLVNTKPIFESLEDMGNVFQTGLDSELFAHLIKKRKSEDRIENIINALRGLEGGFTFLVMTKNRLYACRDKNGIKPLVLGKLGDGYVVSSESCAFEIMGAKFVRDI